MSSGVPEPSDFSLVPFAEIVMPLLDAAGAGTVVEVGADRGDFTRELLAWASREGARVTAIDSQPRPELLDLADANPQLTLIQELSSRALSELPLADVVIIDGDHNYHTVSEELRLILAKAGTASEMPLLLIHDVGWPHARRDTYYDPDRIPEAERQPLARDAMVAPGEPGTAEAGILFGWAAGSEGGPRNGVLTAVEDFLAEAEGLRLAVVPAFFGLAVLWPESAPWAGGVARIVEPWDSSPLLERLEALRVAHIVDRVKLARQEVALRSILSSRAFAVAERVSRLRGRDRAALSRERVRRALGD